MPILGFEVAETSDCVSALACLAALKYGYRCAASELLHGAESPDSAGGISASALSALSTASTQQFTDSRV